MTKKTQGPRPSSKEKRAGFRLTKDEHAALSAKAKELGMSLSGFVRIATLLAAEELDWSQLTGRDESAQGAKNDEAIWALQTELNRIGVNLNQIARQVNQGTLFFMQNRSAAAELIRNQRELIAKLDHTVETLERLS